MADSNYNVALFPIPNVVAFPGSILPLHVFEPRYRQMVADCVDNGMLIAVCHTMKEIRPARKEQSVQDALKNNQATYAPQEIFSAGPCQVLETTADGRLYINIRMERRLRLEGEVQTLPYRVVACSELPDLPLNAEAEAECATLQKSITRRLLTLIGRQNPQMLSKFDSSYWLALAPGDFSFQVFSFLRFDGDRMQEILEMTTALARLETLDDLLGHTGES